MCYNITMNNGGNDHYKSLADALFGLNSPTPKIPTPPYTPKPYTPAAGAANLADYMESVRSSLFPPPQSLNKVTPKAPPALVKLLNPNRLEASAAQSQYSNEVATSIRQVLGTQLPVVKTSSVPRREDIGLSNGRLIESAVLYIDIRNSTSITTRHTDDVAAKIYKAFHESMVTIARYQGRGHVRGFAGDKIMIIFDNNNDAVYRAVDCAIWMQSFIEQKLSPALQAAYDHPIACGIGIDYGKMTAVRAGTKNNNDVVWAGSPANKASKLADSSPGGAIDISYKAMSRIKGAPIIQRKFNLSSATELMRKEGDKLVTHYRLAKVRYTL